MNDNNKEYLFSVLISIYHKENPEWFREALDSVFAQTLQPTEIVLVEDGPLTPELYEVIDEYQSKHPIFNIVKNETNLEEGYDVVSCWSQLFIGDQTNVIAVKTRPENHEEIVKLAHRRSPICHAAAFMRKSAVLKAGNYMHRQYYEDYNLWVRMILNGARFYNVQEVLYEVRTTEEQLRRRGGWSYLKNELKYLCEFYNIGFYTKKDIVVNATIRIVARLMPQGLRSYLFKKIWNHKNN